MRFRYTITEDDLAAAVRQTFISNPELRRQTKRAILLWSLLILCIYIPLAWLSKVWIILLLGLASILWFVFRFERWVVRRAVKINLRMVQDSKGMLGDHEMEVSDGFLIERTDANETKIPVASLHDVSENESHVFISQSPVLIHVVPKRDAPDEAVRELLNLKPASGDPR